MADASPSPVSEPSPDQAVQDFLLGQSSEGRYVSKGHFTIDARVARRKLAQFQLRAPEHWVVVLVQAAHRGGARKVTVTQLPRQTTVSISGGRGWTWKELEAVLDGAETSQADLYTYAVAARALTGNAAVSGFRIITSDWVTARWRNDRFETGPLKVEDALAVGTVVFEVQHVGRFEKASPWVEQRATARAELAAINVALTHDCLASSVPIWLDGRLLAGPHLGEPATANQVRRPLAVAPLEHPLVPASDFGTYTQWQSSTIGGVQLSLPAHQAPKGPLAGLAVIWVSFLPGRRSVGLFPDDGSRLLWVQDGVVVHREKIRLQGSLGLTVIASAAGLKTDLSGLVLIENEQMAERREFVREALRTSLERVVEEGKGAVQVTRERPSAGRVLFLLAGVAGAVAFPPSLAVTGPVAMISYGTRALQRAESNTWDAALDRQLESLAERAFEGFPQT